MFFPGVGEFVDATEEMEEMNKQLMESENAVDDPKLSLQPGTFTDDR